MLKKIAVAALGLMLVAGPIQAADKMRISLQLPLKSHLGQNLLVFEKEVEARTKGAIDVEIYDSAQLYKDKEVPAAVGAGSIESGVASLTRYVGDIPAVDLFYQPFLLNTDKKVRKGGKLTMAEWCERENIKWYNVDTLQELIEDVSNT